MRSLDSDREPHVGELALRRYRAGELGAAERASIEQQLADSAELRARLDALDDEQRLFERQIPFDRFASGVARSRHTQPAPRRRTSIVAAFAGLVATAAAFAVFVRPTQPTNRLKGGDGDVVLARIGGSDGHQRDARPGAVTALAPGERVRVGYRVTGARRIAVLTIDDGGVVTPLYPAGGDALVVEAATTDAAYLPDSIEFLGRGRERLSVLLGDEAFTVDDAMTAARLAYQRAGSDVTRANVVPPDGARWHETAFVFDKP